MTEEWRAVPGYEGCYEVSDHGRVRSLSRRFLNSYNPPRLHRIDGRVLTTNHRRGGQGSAGYQSCTLSDAAGKRRDWSVHALVLLAFVGPRPEGQWVRHLDGDEDNNHLSNLAYGTPSENEADKVAHGDTPFGTREPHAKLTDDAVREIRRLAGTVSQRALAAQFGVHQGVIWRVVNRRSWRHVR